jgi:hypothetical protein
MLLVWVLLFLKETRGSRMKMTLCRLSLTVLVGVLSIGAAGATSISFSYNGVGDPGFDPDGVASGSGSFTTDDSNNPAGIADLSSFTFSFSLTSGGFTDNYTYGLADLVTFQANFSGATLTGLTLTTDYQPAIFLWFEAFNVTGLGANQAFSDDGDGDDPSTGTLAVNQSAAPEPGTLGLMAGGLMGFAILLRLIRHRRALRT